MNRLLVIWDTKEGVVGINQSSLSQRGDIREVMRISPRGVEVSRQDGRVVIVREPIY